MQGGTVVAKTWNKADIAEAVAAKTDMTKKDATAAVDALLEVITKALKDEDKIQLTGFGTFETRKRAARKARNPQTGEQISIKASTVPAFKAGKGLKDAVG